MFKMVEDEENLLKFMNFVILFFKLMKVLQRDYGFSFCYKSCYFLISCLITTSWHEIIQKCWIRLLDRQVAYVQRMKRGVNWIPEQKRYNWMRLFITEKGDEKWKSEKGFWLVAQIMASCTSKVKEFYFSSSQLLVVKIN